MPLICCTSLKNSTSDHYKDALLTGDGFIFADLISRAGVYSKVGSSAGVAQEKSPHLDDALLLLRYDTGIST